MKHTPTPWMTHGRFVITGNDIGPIDAGDIVDAAHIVHAVNCHEELLEALYSILNIEGPAIKEMKYGKAFTGLDVEYHFEKVRAAIAKAEGR